ncbi:MAG: hypothetical protein ACLU84_01185 [Clostridia bacterium]
MKSRVLSETEILTKHFIIFLQYDGRLYHARCEFTKEIKELEYLYLRGACYISTSFLPNHISFCIEAMEKNHQVFCYPLSLNAFTYRLYPIFEQELLSNIQPCIFWKEQWISL